MNRSIFLLSLVVLKILSILPVNAHGDDAPVNNTLNTAYKYALFTTPVTVIILMAIYFIKYGGKPPLMVDEAN